MFTQIRFEMYDVCENYRDDQNDIIDVKILHVGKKIWIEHCVVWNVWKFQTAISNRFLVTPEQ